MYRFTGSLASAIPKAESPVERRGNDLLLQVLVTLGISS
jgi:hypothetical protein